jgi:ectoine hydroxylase-related dioxygenase (phytanoyl-CoA dioxygenase family)
MNDLTGYKAALSEFGFSTIEGVYSPEAVQKLLRVIDHADSDKATFRKSADLFAIRQFLKEVPAAFDLVFTDQLKALLSQVMGEDYFVVKSIYFDKPETSNWYVAYHQDLTISVDKQLSIPGFGPWTTKQNQYAVQPPITFLEDIITVRIHLDHTDDQNGALKVIPGSHLNQITRPEHINWTQESPTTCAVPQGGVMLMKPLLLHSSGRTTNHKKRRVIHIECASKEPPGGLQWAERMHW